MRTMIINLVIRVAAVLGAIFFRDPNVRLVPGKFGIEGAVWLLRGIWFQKILGFNRDAPTLVHPFLRVSDFKNLKIPLSSYNNLQTPGAYYQNFSALICIGEGCFIAPNVGLITANHTLDNLSHHTVGQDIVIGDHCWIGMNSVVLPGVTLGARTIVGAGSVVTKSYPDGHVVLAGNPARPIKVIS